MTLKYNYIEVTCKHATQNYCHLWGTLHGHSDLSSNLNLKMEVDWGFKLCLPYVFKYSLEIKY